MKKKLFSILALLCMAVTGAWAEEITIGDPTSTTTSSYLPSYSLYDYSLSQQIYTADEIGTSGTINALTMWLKNNSSYARNYNIYMKEVSQSSFADGNAWVSMAESNLVATATLSNGITDPVETTFTLTTPFEYSGTGNLVICFQDVTGHWSSGVASVVMITSGHQAIYAYRDGSLFDPTSPGVTGSFATKDNEGVKSVVKFDISASGFELTVGTTEYGTITFTNAAGEEITSAAEGEVVTVTVTPDDEHEAAGVTGEWYAAIAAARVADEGTFVDLLTDIEFTPVEDTDNQWTFVMQRANAEVSASFWDLADIIEMLREQVELAKVVFKKYGDTKDDEMLEQMFHTVGTSIILLRNYDKGLEVSLQEAYELYKALKKFNAMFAEDIATGIKNVNVNENGNENENRYYNLNGRKVMNPTKGIYILNGKKVVIK